MAEPKTPEAIARWAGKLANKKSKPADTPAYRRLTNADRALILQYDKEGLTQVAIAQRLGCAQSTVSDWLSQCQDSTPEATRYLRGQALRMARNIVRKGRASDHIKTLEGINVLVPEQHKPGVVVQIGIKDSDVELTLSPPLSQPLHRPSD